jgi:hypothetical protein
MQTLLWDSKDLLPNVADSVDRSALTSTEIAHFARNIAAWREYLPPDCVAAMIRMGWHRST